MKIEQLLVQYFYKQREVTLQGIGTFSLSPDFVFPTENDKDAAIPDNAISFRYNSRAAEDAGLISYIVEQTRKMRPLAAADLDSYLVLGKQFLNIGKPFKIEGLGMLLKNQQGEYEFAQGQSIQAKGEEAPAAALKEKFEDDDISFASESKRSPGSKKGLMIASLLAIAGIAGAAAWYFFIRDTEPAAIETVKTEPVLKQEPDTAKTVTIIPDSTTVKEDTVFAAVPPPVSNDGYAFKVVFRVMSRTGALKKKDELKKANVIMYTTDSVHYKLAEGFNRPLSDTTRIKDSLRIFYAFRTFIELK